jgi:cytochrome bd ubiquinol oxidase subunit I
MNPELLSRFQFAFTTSFHFIYPPLSMGLGVLLVVLGILHLRTRNPLWREISFFWLKVFGIVFAMGIATGVVQEFEFGTNWSQYSRFVGNIFGSLLAAEGIFAFFLEGGFLGLALFGGDRLGPRMWLLAVFLVTFGAHFSALWIIMANSWMQTPAGFTIAQTAQGEIAYMTNFWSVVFTPSFIPRILHVWVASWISGAAFMLSVAAWYIIKNRYVEQARLMFKVALPWFAVLAILQVFVFGALQAVEVTNSQGVKLAAMEGLWESQSCAPMYLIGWVNEANQTTVGLSIPCLLSFLSYGSFQAVVPGLTSFPSNAYPPINLVFQVYHIMINLGFLFIPIGLLGALFYYWRQRIFQMKWLLGIFVASIFLAELAIQSGWWTAEFGRQPWIVWNLLLTSNAVSPLLTGPQLISSVGMFVVLYVILFVLFIFLLNEKIQHGIEPLVEAAPLHSLPDTFREIFRSKPGVA